MTETLNIGGKPVFDDRIVKIETHTYNPYANTTFKYSDEIRIPIQQQDLYTLPCESFLYVEGTLTVTRAAGQADNVKRRNNQHAQELLYVTVSSDRSVILRNAGWEPHNNANGYFNFCVPLNLLLGFCEDYKRVVINARHELILIRSRTNNNCLLGSLALEPTVKLLKIQWRMPHVVLSEVNKLSMLRALENGRYLSMGFRSWDLYEYPLLQNTTKHSWAIKTASQLKKPRYVIFALQTGRKNVMSADTSRFDDCKLINVKL
ncbi:uncharacterized protein [Temnothorax longispinosus]|uniref:uncharacterized protein n=1 Tax=Temnothorax longispinosus TaxID=300112 RepID=UPI003A991D31